MCWFPVCTNKHKQQNIGLEIARSKARQEMRTSQAKTTGCFWTIQGIQFNFHVTRHQVSICSCKTSQGAVSVSSGVWSSTVFLRKPFCLATQGWQKYGFPLLVQLFENQKQTSQSCSLSFDGCENKTLPQTLLWYQTYFIFTLGIITASLLFPLCEKTAQRASNSLHKVMVWQPPTPRNTLLQHFTHTHPHKDTQRHTFTYKRRRFSHHKPQPFNGRRRRRRRNSRWITETEISVLLMVTQRTQRTSTRNSEIGSSEFNAM